MIVEIIVSVLPRPITSASMPPVEYEGMLSWGLFHLSALGIKHCLHLITLGEEYVRYIRKLPQPLVHVLTVEVGLPALDEPERGNLVTRIGSAETTTS